MTNDFEYNSEKVDGKVVVESHNMSREPTLARARRRIFNALRAFAIVSSLFLAACSSGATAGVEQNATPDPFTDFLTKTFAGQSEPDYDELPLDPQTELLIESIEAKNGFNIISPTIYANMDNMPWGDREIQAIDDAYQLLPPSFILDNVRTPERVVLVKDPTGISPGCGGGYADRTIFLMMTKSFSPDTMLPYPREFFADWAGPTELDNVKFAFIHEWTHSFSEAHPEVLSEFAEKTGWVQDSSGNWSNPHTDELFYFGNAEKYPWEDFSSKVATLALNPNKLPQRDLDFFLQNHYFDNWKALDPFR